MFVLLSHWHHIGIILSSWYYGYLQLTLLDSPHCKLESEVTMMAFLFKSSGVNAWEQKGMVDLFYSYFLTFQIIVVDTALIVATMSQSFIIRVSRWAYRKLLQINFLCHIKQRLQNCNDTVTFVNFQKWFFNLLSVIYVKCSITCLDMDKINE